MNYKYKEYVIPLAIFMTVFMYSSFFLQGIRFFDNDYNICLVNAHTYSFPTVLWQIFDPILKDWNAEYRPTQTLIFKVLFYLFGYDPSGYYYFKSFMLALFSTVYFLFLRRYLNISVVAVFSALFLAMFSSTFESLKWVSDLVIVSEFLALLVYVLFLYLETLENPPKIKLFTCLALMVVLTLICDRTRASGKLIPGILLFYIIIFDWNKIKRYGLTIVLMITTILPWQALISNPVPFLSAKPDTVKPYLWQPASINKFWSLFGGDFEFFSLFYSGHFPTSVLAIIGFPILYAFILAAIVLIVRHAHIQKGEKLLIIWAAVNIASLTSYPSLPPDFRARYAISVLSPLIPLVLLIIYRAAQFLCNRRWIPGLIIGTLVIMQICFHGYHTFRARNGYPTFMIASDNLREYIANNYKNSLFFYQHFPVLAFRPTADGNQFFDQDVGFTTVEQISLKAHSPLYIASRFTINDNVAEFVKSFPGKSESLYDRIFNSGDHQYYETVLHLYKYSPVSQPENQNMTSDFRR